MRLAISIVSNSGFHLSAGLFCYRQGVLDVWRSSCSWEILIDEDDQIWRDSFNLMIWGGGSDTYGTVQSGITQYTEVLKLSPSIFEAERYD